MRPRSLLCGALLAFPAALVAQNAPAPTPPPAPAPAQPNGFWIEGGSLLATGSTDDQSGGSFGFVWKNGARLYAIDVSGYDVSAERSHTSYTILFGHDTPLNKWFSSRWQLGPAYQTDHEHLSLFFPGGPNSETRTTAGIGAHGRVAVEFSGLRFVTYGLRLDAEIGSRYSYVGIGALAGFGLRR